MVYFSLICCYSACGSTLAIIGSWTEHWVFRKSYVQFAKVVKLNAFCSLSHDKNWTSPFFTQCVCVYIQNSSVSLCVWVCVCANPRHTTLFNLSLCLPLLMYQLRVATVLHNVFLDF